MQLTVTNDVKKKKGIAHYNTLPENRQFRTFIRYLIQLALVCFMCVLKCTNTHYSHFPLLEMGCYKLENII